MSSFNEVYNKLGELAATVTGRVITAEDEGAGWYDGFTENATTSYAELPQGFLVPAEHFWGVTTRSFYPAEPMASMDIYTITYRLNNQISWGAQESRNLNISAVNKTAKIAHLVFMITDYIDDGLGRSALYSYRTLTVSAHTSTSLTTQLSPDSYRWEVSLAGVVFE